MVKIDPEFQTLIPPLTDDEYQRLEKSILAEGVRECIITWDDTIIDGHNRYRICQKHGLECPNIERTFKSRDAAKIWIIENQFGRRNLGKYDRGVLALRLEPLYTAEAKRNSDANLKRGTIAPDSQKSDTREIGRTDERIAKLAGMSRDTIRKVKVIETEAEKGNETAIAARDSVIKGIDSIHKAFTKVRHNGDKTDTRNICTMCGKPINEGDYYPRDTFKHKQCANKLEHKNKIAAKGRYLDAERDLRENVAIYTVESLLNELTASANNLRQAWDVSIEINESMGVKLTARDKKQLGNATANLFNAIERIRGKHENV